MSTQSLNTHRESDIQTKEPMGVFETLNYSTLPALNSMFVASKHDQDALVRTIGQRMREARELCNLSQSEAARRLGYANPSKLSKVEAAADTSSVPLWLIHGAARLYEVSADYLFGITDDWETGAPRGTQAFLLDTWERLRQRDLAALDRVHAEAVTLSGTTNAVVDAVRGVGMALSVYGQRNPEFENSPASNTLVTAVARLEAAAKAADAGLKRYQLRTSKSGSC